MWSLKRRSSSIKLDREAVAEKQPQPKWSNVYLQKAKTAQKDAFSLAVNPIRQLKVGVVTVHSLCIACFTSHNRKTAPQHHIIRGTCRE